MSYTLTINADNSITLPEGLLADLAVKQGDTLVATPTARGLTFSRAQPSFEEQMTVARRVMREDYDVLKKLAE